MPKAICGIRCRIIVLLTSLLLFGAGCATESRIWQSGAEPPWRWDGERVSGDQRLYVGIGTADNVLDEAQGRRLAITNAAERVGASIEQGVASEIVISTERTGPAHKGQDEASEVVKAEVRAISQQIVRQMHPKEWYYERWRVRQGMPIFGSSFTRYKFFVQAAYPLDEYDRVMKSMIDKLESQLDFLLPRIDAALSAGNTENALQLAERAILHHPDEFRSWWASYMVHAAAENWRNAVESLRKCETTAVNDTERRTAEQTLRTSADKLATALQEKAEAAHTDGNHNAALSLLEEAWGIAHNRTQRRMLSQRYYDILAETATIEIEQKCRELDISTVALGTFIASAGHTSTEAEAFKEAIARQLKSRGKLGVTMYNSSSAEVARLLDGDWRNTDAMRNDFAERNLEGLIIARIGEEITVRLAHFPQSQTLPVTSGRSLEAIRGRPDLPIWDELDKLIPPNTESAFNVSVWTPRQEYRIGDEIQIHFRADRSCHVYLIDIQTSGGMYLLFPNPFHPTSAVTAGKEYVIPDPKDRYAIEVSGPPGWEGLKIIATLRPLNLGIERTGEFAKIDDNRQRQFVHRLAEELKKLRKQDWAEGAWAVFTY